MTSQTPGGDDYQLQPITPLCGSTEEVRCPSCQTVLTPSAVLCVGCGYHLVSRNWLATEVSGATEAPDDTAVGQISRQQFVDRCVRIFGWSWLLLPVGYLTILLFRCFISGGHYELMFDTLGVVLTAIIGFLGVIVARNGASFGPEAELRRKGGAIGVVIGLLLSVAVAGLIIALAIAMAVVGNLELSGLLVMLAIVAGSAGILILAASVAVLAMGQRISESWL